MPLDPEYQTRVEGGTFILEFKAPSTLLLHPEYQNMVWDECLRRAHNEGCIPVGPVLVTEERIEKRQVESLIDGVPMDIGAAVSGSISYDVMKVRAEVSIGAAL
jgi:hypothetical protein